MLIKLVELVRLHSNPSVSPLRVHRLRCDAMSRHRATTVHPTRVPQRVTARLGSE